MLNNTMPKTKRTIIIICVVAVAIVLITIRAQYSLKYMVRDIKIFENVSEIDDFIETLENVEQTDVSEDKNLKNLALESSRGYVCTYNGTKVYVKAYVFTTEQEAGTYYKRISGDTKNYDFNARGKMDLFNCWNIIVEDNKILYVYSNRLRATTSFEEELNKYLTKHLTSF